MSVSSESRMGNQITTVEGLLGRVWIEIAGKKPTYAEQNYSYKDGKVLSCLNITNFGTGE